MPLLRFVSSKSGDDLTSFDQYIEGMPEEQKSIYYVTGEGQKSAMMQPVVEKLTSRGYEVLLMTEPLDEIVIEAVESYKDLKLVDASKEGLDIEDGDEEKKKEKEELNEKFADIREFLEVELEGKVQKVTVSTLLTDSPAALVQGAYGVSPTMQRFMKAQAVERGADPRNVGLTNQAILEINPKHPIVQDLEKMVSKDKDSEETKNFAMLMYDIASMTSGYEVSDTNDFAQRVMALMTTKAKQDGVQNESVATNNQEDEDDAITPEIVA